MILIITTALILSLAVAAPPPSNLINYSTDNVQILKYENENFGNGGYSFAFEQSDGTKHEQQGEIQNEGRDDEYIGMRGVFSWIGPNGIKYTVTYVADTDGYQPTVEEGPGALPPMMTATLLG